MAEHRLYILKHTVSSSSWSLKVLGHHRVSSKFRYPILNTYEDTILSFFWCEITSLSTNWFAVFVSASWGISKNCWIINLLHLLGFTVPLEAQFSPFEDLGEQEAARWTGPSPPDILRQPFLANTVTTKRAEMKRWHLSLFPILNFIKRLFNLGPPQFIQTVNSLVVLVIKREGAFCTHCQGDPPHQGSTGRTVSPREHLTPALSSAPSSSVKAST